MKDAYSKIGKFKVFVKWYDHFNQLCSLIGDLVFWIAYMVGQGQTEVLCSFHHPAIFQQARRNIHYLRTRHGRSHVVQPGCRTVYPLKCCFVHAAIIWF